MGVSDWSNGPWLVYATSLRSPAGPAGAAGAAHRRFAHRPAPLPRPRHRLRTAGRQRRPGPLPAGGGAVAGVLAPAGGQLRVPGHDGRGDRRGPVRRLRRRRRAGAGLALGAGRPRRLPEAQPDHPVPGERFPVPGAAAGRGRHLLLVRARRRGRRRDPGQPHPGAVRPRRGLRAGRCGALPPCRCHRARGWHPALVARAPLADRQAGADQLGLPQPGPAPGRGRGRSAR